MQSQGGLSAVGFPLSAKHRGFNIRDRFLALADSRLLKADSF